MKSWISKILRNPTVLFALRGRSIGMIILAIVIVIIFPFLAGYGLMDEGDRIEDIFSTIQILLGS
jgi:hypothetical protein